jgi:hypothetical protein
MTPATPGAVSLALRLVAATTWSGRAFWPQPIRASGRPFPGTPAVGALFAVTPGGPGGHFCTASVVDSPVKDLVITAAHCVTGREPGQIAFVPGYHDGSRPYGTWTVRQVVVDAGWRDSQNPNRDVAFLVVREPGGTGIQDVTGGVRLATGWRARARVHVIGYPDDAGRPVLCAARTHPFGPHQLRFDCGGYTDGTSGGPFLARWHAGGGTGLVIGVIGGYQQGGDLPWVSYSPRFGHAIRSLYRAAVAAARAPG